MLAPAISVEDKINAKLQKHAFDERLKYYFTQGRESLTVDIRESTWYYLQAASLSQDGEVLGYISANTDRQNHSVTAMKAVRFPEEPSVTFARDFCRYLRALFEKWDFKKVTWRAAASNPAADMYRRIADKAGGREVGRLQDHAVLPDGSVEDLIIFEVMREDYLDRAD